METCGRPGISYSNVSNFLRISGSAAHTAALQHCSTAALQGDCSAVVQPAAEPHAAALDILFL